MRRACMIPSVNDGKPFEAWGAREVPSNGLGVCLTTGRFQITFIPVDSAEELEATRASITFQLAQALNPPIKVGRAVLKAMEKVPEASFWYVEGSVNVRLKWDDTLKTFTVNGQTLSITDYIQADCPLALQVLLQFNTEGELFDA